MGFCVASTRNGSGTRWVVPAMVTWRSAMTSSSADWTLAGARLISSASTKLANTGPSSTSKVPESARYTRVPVMSDGSRSGVNCSRAKVPPTAVATVSTVRVLARPGTPSIRQWPEARRHTSTRSSSRSCPTMTFLASKRMRSRSAASSVAGALCSPETGDSGIPERYRGAPPSARRLEGQDRAQPLALLHVVEGGGHLVERATGGDHPLQVEPPSPPQLEQPGEVATGVRRAQEAAQQLLLAEPEGDGVDGEHVLQPRHPHHDRGAAGTGGGDAPL